MTSSGGGPLEFHNIQEIVNIELMFKLICMLLFFLVSFYPHYKLSEEETNNKTGESITLLLFYIVVKRM